MLNDLEAAMVSHLASYLERIRNDAIGFADRLSDLSTYPFFVTPTDRIHAFYLFSFFVIALILFLRRTRGRNSRSISGFFEFFLPRSIYLHRSSFLDLKFYLVNRVFVEVAFLSAVIGSFAVIGDAFEAMLHFLWTAPEPQLEIPLSVRAAYVVAIALASDLGFFLGHTFGHRVPLFWEFHKVHHAAEVLNPLTNYRFHPLDKILLGLVIGVVTGIVNGGFGFAFSTDIKAIAALNMAIYLTYNLFSNLRHSHIWLSYGWHASHIFSSPAQHQIHHSTEARHIDKNFGLMLSIWDWLAGTLYVPKEREDFKVGLRDQEHRDYDTLWRLYTLPLVRAASLLLGRPAPARRPEGNR